MSIFSRVFGSGKVEKVNTELKDEDYLELDNVTEKIGKSKILVKSFMIREFGDIKEPIDALREGYTISLINIKPLKDKDLVELKRTISKLKKVCDAIEGDIAGFGEDWIVATPSFAEVFRAGAKPTVSKEIKTEVKDDDF